MELKRFESNRINEVITLFRETILTVNTKDYSKEQVEEWANNRHTVDEWVNRLDTSLTYIALINDKIVGFGNMTDEGLVDLLYVHKNHQAEGIGSMLVTQLEADAKRQNFNCITTEASITAKPFFLSKGYFVHQKQLKLIAGTRLTNYKMVKELGGIKMDSPIKNQINTIFVHVTDLAKSVEWYTKLLGQGYTGTEVSDPVYNLKINDHTGLTVDAGLKGEVKTIIPSPYPLFNFHTADINTSYEFVENTGFQIDSDIVEFDDFAFFTVKDPDNHIIMICTG
ncbi:GNAT family N-acetyltransferase [Virgibacillus phasianinus]|uniref:GNAT family N-acetyltransferase n=1 Tax=Virgibacillus phasianinus TaxID=2017483 RepID=UPI00155FFC9D|nr:GNAT family N-acetyltransferase [Virgibacillus phasianinus]